MRKSKITHYHPHHHYHSRQREPLDEFMFGLEKKLLANQELVLLLAAACECFAALCLLRLKLLSSCVFEAL